MVIDIFLKKMHHDLFLTTPLYLIINYNINFTTKIIVLIKYLLFIQLIASFIIIAIKYDLKCKLQYGKIMYSNEI